MLCSRQCVTFIPWPTSVNVGKGHVNAKVLLESIEHRQNNDPSLSSIGLQSTHDSDSASCFDYDPLLGAVPKPENLLRKEYGDDPLPPLNLAVMVDLITSLFYETHQTEVNMWPFVLRAFLSQRTVVPGPGTSFCWVGII